MECKDIHGKGLKEGDKVRYLGDFLERRGEIGLIQHVNTDTDRIFIMFETRDFESDYHIYSYSKQLELIEKDTKILGSNPAMECKHPDVSLKHSNRFIGSVQLLDEQGGLIEEVKANHHMEYFNRILRSIEVSAQKNHDYAGGNHRHPLANFNEVQDLGIDPIDGILTRMSDKWGRIKTFKTQGKLAVNGEGFEDALMDLGNYCFIALALLSESKKSD